MALLEDMCHCGVDFEVSYAQDTTQCFHSPTNDFKGLTVQFIVLMAPFLEPVFCISYFSQHWNQIYNKTQLKRFILAYGFRGYYTYHGKEGMDG